MTSLETPSHTSQQRRRLIGGNWKMHHLRQDAETYCRIFRSELETGTPPETQVVLFPSFPLLPIVSECLAGSAVAIGGQDLHPEAKGAHTGDTSGAQLADSGCSWVLCGHSERRSHHAETDEVVMQKTAAALSSSLTPLICLGESEQERESDRTFEVLARQLGGALRDRPGPFALAYEPVWAIGTGKTATPEIAQTAHRFLRETLADLLGDEVAAAKRILYGGSVNPENAADLIGQPDIDGFLVGGASLDPERFMAIIRCCG